MFHNAVVPIISVGLTIGLKICSKKEMKFEEQDLAIGLEIFVTTVALLLVAMIELGFDSKSISSASVEPGVSAQLALEQFLQNQSDLRTVSNKITEGVVYLFILMIFIFTTAMVVRGFGWNRQDPSRLNRFGIWVPTFLGVTSLVIVSFWVQ